jgi:hypothetical protein
MLKRLCALCVLVYLAAPLVAQRAELKRSSWSYAMPVWVVDSNSPVYWRDGQLHLVNSTGTPYQTAAANQFDMQPAFTELVASDSDRQPSWIESVWQDDDGTLFAWYHWEPAGVCGASAITAPQIGALVSHDGGRTFTNLGIILAATDAPDCSAKNGFFAGGHGDFSVIVDRERQFFYFLFSNYGGAGQGVAIARMAFENREFPVDAVWKYFEGHWDEPGLGGRVTPLLPARVGWDKTNTDSFWGPSVHWNTYLETYVMLLNRSCCSPGWPQEGIYVSYNRHLGDPGGWSTPQLLIRGKDIAAEHPWYPQVIGLGAGETDTLAGQVARFWVKGFSNWEIVFSH